MGLKTFSAGMSIVAASIAILANFRSASTALVELWPVMEPALPILGLSGAVGGLTLVGGCVWKWYVARQPKRPPGPEEGFRQLAPDVEWWYRERGQQYPTNLDEQADVMTRYRRTRDALTALGVTLPEESEHCVRFIVMARLGELAKARKQFPLQPKDDGPVVSD